MAIDTIARGLATSIYGSDGRIAANKMPKVEIADTTGFTSIGKLTDPSLVAGKTSEEILLMMLFGIVTPALKAPSVRLVLNEEISYLIVGEKKTINGVVQFDRGSIEPAYGTSGKRSGLPTSYQVNESVYSSNDLSLSFSIDITPVPGENILSYAVFYSAGEQPLNSIGQPFEAPLPAGMVSGSISIDGVYQLYSADLIPMSFNWFEDTDGEGYQSIFLSEGSGTKQAFALDSRVSVVGFKAIDPITKEWIWLGGEGPEVSLSFFDITEDKENNRKIYTHNYFTVGERELRIYVA